jgi:prepilin-type N-terminal cleavage/methylation domain-containing protein
MKGLVRNEKGFTLIELLVVLGILSILLAIAAPRFANSLSQAEIQAHNANVSMLERAVELAYLGGDIVLTIGSEVTVDLNTVLVGNNYLKEVPPYPMGGAVVYEAWVKKESNGALTITVKPVRQ